VKKIPVGRRHGIEVISPCLSTYFNEHLKGLANTRINDSDEQYSENMLAINNLY
jgi:hypothetical protein